MSRRASRLVLIAAVALAAYAGPNYLDRNPQHVEQRAAAQCAEEIELLQEARWEASVRAARARLEGDLVATSFSVDASCGEAIDADTERCRREAERVTAGRTPKEDLGLVTYPPRDEAADDFDPYALLEDLDGYPVECDWAVLDALTGNAPVALP
ncbi:hypothetical protein G6045_25550 [Streptomyces sp. YC504]|uniref:Secreted protein n=1 Tax=Streptomyces mesophilus TaxID=1775132 RepID=A0A6G4XQA6_9ACTN|nr:hypothetical protein [Streptomyces mesophilus]NGO78997.1 hypothetical protein [Streptomyces mesophilus]